MKTRTKVALVAGGYVAALLAASAAVALRLATAVAADVQASSGMYAAGDAMTFLAVFGLVAVVPTALALWFLRSNQPLWNIVAMTGVFLAMTGIGAIILYVTERSAGVHTILGELAGLAPLRMLAAPLFALTFFVFGVISPHRFPRVALLVSALAESAVAACTAWLWFVPLLRR